jgi:hypothetical protein
MFLFGLVVGGLVFGVVGLLVGANNPGLVKTKANQVEAGIKDKTSL